MTVILGYEMPEELYFHKDHTWVRLENDGSITMGMTDFYSKQAGDTTYVDLMEKGEELVAGETAGKIQSSKWVGKLIAPVSGEIMAINEALEDDFLLINNHPYREGWIMKIRPSDLQQDLKNLYHGTEAVTAFLESAIKDTEKKS